MHYQSSRRLYINNRSTPAAKVRLNVLAPKNRMKYVVLPAFLLAFSAGNAIAAYHALFPAACRPTITVAANDPQESVFARGIDPAEETASQAREDLPQAGSFAENRAEKAAELTYESARPTLTHPSQDASEIAFARGR